MWGSLPLSAQRTTVLAETRRRAATSPTRRWVRVLPRPVGRGHRFLPPPLPLPDLALASESPVPSDHCPVAGRSPQSPVGAIQGRAGAVDRAISARRPGLRAHGWGALRGQGAKAATPPSWPAP